MKYIKMVDTSFKIRYKEIDWTWTLTEIVIKIHSFHE